MCSSAKFHSPASLKPANHVTELWSVMCNSKLAGDLGGILIFLNIGMFLPDSVLFFLPGVSMKCLEPEQPSCDLQRQLMEL